MNIRSFRFVAKRQLVIIFLVGIVSGLTNLNDLYILLVRNMFMRGYTAFYFDTTTASISPQLIEYSKQDIRLKPLRPLSWARFSSILGEINHRTGSEASAIHAISLAGFPNCNMKGDVEFIRSLAYLRKTKYSIDNLNFSHIQSNWIFHLNEDAVGSFTYYPDYPNQNKCIAQVMFDFDMQPNRYIVFWRNVTLIANQKYRLSAYVSTRGVNRAWLGIRSRWTGSQILNAQSWQIVNFEFVAQPTDTLETVQIVIEGGHGEMSIRDVKLEPIAP